MTGLSASRCIMQLRIKQHRARGKSTVSIRTITLWAVLSSNAHLQDSDGIGCTWCMPEKQNHAQNLYDAAAAEQRLFCDMAFNQRCCFREALMLNASRSTAKSNKLWPEAWVWVCHKTWQFVIPYKRLVKNCLQATQPHHKDHDASIYPGAQGQEQACSKWRVLCFP